MDKWEGRSNVERVSKHAIGRKERFRLGFEGIQSELERRMGFSSIGNTDNLESSTIGISWIPMLRH